MKYKRLHTRRIKRSAKRIKNPQKRYRFTKVHGLIAVIIFAGIGWYGIHIVSGLPSLNQLDNPRPDYASKVYSADGELLGQYSIINRSQVSIDELPPYLINALIASEDRKFYRHRGIDIDRIIKATVKNFMSFRIREGASTITQQVARNLYLDHEQSITRKLREAITALQIERRFSKENILELYFNLAYFGNSSYGVAAASNRYFNKSISELTLNESALLVGLLPNPVLYDPTIHTERALTRRNIVLNSMKEMEYISAAVAHNASTRPVDVIDRTSISDSNIAPHFVEHVRRQLSNLSIEYGFDIYRDGLTIHTTLDSPMQRHANRAVAGHLKSYQRMFDQSWTWETPRHRKILQAGLEREIRNHHAYRTADNDKERESVRTTLLANDQFKEKVKRRLETIQTGFVAINPSSGEIKAMVGGSDYHQNRHGLNRVTQSRRQPGSAFKPFIYTAAIDNGYPPYYQLPNEPVTITTTDGTLWQPSNVDGLIGGEVSLRDGLANSINIVAVRTMMDLAPVTEVIDNAHRMGITSHLHPYESLSLGTSEVSPLELTSAYGVYAANGSYSAPYAITRIEGNEGQVIVSFEPEKKQAIKPETAYIMTDMLRDVIDYGTGRTAKEYINFPAAGKTGTTQGNADGWFIGYTPDLVAGVWVGFDDSRVTLGTADGMGSRSALPIWARFMKNTYEDNSIGLRARDFEVPSGIARAALCAETLLLSTDNCPEYFEEVLYETELPDECDEHTSFFRSVKNFISRIFK